MVLLGALGLLERTEDERNPLVQVVRRDVENSLPPGAREAARLLDDEDTAS